MTESAHPNISSVPLDHADEVAQPRKRVMLPVSFGQWDRLKARVAKLGKPRIEFVNYVTGAWGIAIPCALSFAVYLNQDERPNWALPVYGFGALAAAGLAIILRRFQGDEADVREEDAEDIVAEMNSIEEAYLRGGDSS